MMREWMGRVRQVVGRLWPGRRARERYEALAERLRRVEARLEELEGVVKVSKGEEMSEVAGGGGGPGGWPLREEEAGEESGSVIAPLAGETPAPREVGETAAPREDGGQGTDRPTREDEMLEKAEACAREDTDDPHGSGGHADGMSVDVRRGMPQGIPGQQARRKAARFWEGVL
jgi:hypothetical protein